MFILRLFLVLMIAVGAIAAEEELNLETEAAPPPAQQSSQHGKGISVSNVKLMGRVDLTNELTPYNPERPANNNKFKSYHLLIFVKATPSEKVDFLGEIVSQAFYEIKYRPTNHLGIHFGKIIVPFGDTRRYHHFYGGIQGYGARGVMFPNIWAEKGINTELEVGAATFDLYWVSGIAAQTPASDPDFSRASDDSRQAVGWRGTFNQISKVTAIGSFYFEEWLPGKHLYLGGLDLYTEYGLFDAAVLRNLRIGMGRAVADIQKGTRGDFQKSGDYIELVTNAARFAEFRTRYGTYDHNSTEKTSEDVHNFNVGMMTNVDVMRLLVEYQWNFEAVNETDNDIFRAMLSLDF